MSALLLCVQPLPGKPFCVQPLPGKPDDSPIAPPAGPLCKQHHFVQICIKGVVHFNPLAVTPLFENGG